MPTRSARRCWIVASAVRGLVLPCRFGRSPLLQPQRRAKRGWRRGNGVVGLGADSLCACSLFAGTKPPGSLR